jgi:hypothetical protein
MTLFSRRRVNITEGNDRVAEEDDALVDVLRQAYSSAQIPEDLLSSVGAAVRVAQMKKRRKHLVRRESWRPALALAAVPALGAALVAAGITGGFGIGTPGSNATSGSRLGPETLAPVNNNGFSVRAHAAYLPPRTVRVTYSIRGRESDAPYASLNAPVYGALSYRLSAAASVTHSLAAYSGGKKLAPTGCGNGQLNVRGRVATACFRLERAVTRHQKHTILLAAPISTIMFGHATVPSAVSHASKHAPVSHAPVFAQADLQTSRGCGHAGLYLCWTVVVGPGSHSISFPLDAARALHSIPPGARAVTIDAIARRSGALRSIEGSTLTHVRVTKPRTVARLAHRIDDLSVQSMLSACPEMVVSPTSLYRLTFDYGSGHKVTASVPLAGCNAAVSLPWRPSHGFYAPSPTLLAELNALVWKGKPHW